MSKPVYASVTFRFRGDTPADEEMRDDIGDALSEAGEGAERLFRLALWDVGADLTVEEDWS
jgi:hypothetical protein